MMKIAFDAKRAFCNNRGLGNYSRTLVNDLAQYDSDNNYYLFTPKVNDYQLFAPKDNMQVITPQGVWKKAKSAWRRFGIESYLLNEKVDLYHGLSHEIPHYSKKSKTQYVVTVHDLIFMKSPESYTYFDRNIYKRKLLDACKRSDRIVAISQQTKGDLINYLGVPQEKISVIYQACPFIATDRELSGNQRAEITKKWQLPSAYMLYVGAIVYNKNIDLIIEAMHQMKTVLPLVIAGNSSPYLKVLKTKIKEYKLDKKVFFLHGLTHSEIKELYDACQFVVFPSRNEGFGLPIIEAQAHRKPIVTTKGGCFEEAGGAAAVYIDPFSANDLAEALTRLMHDKSLRMTLIEKGIENLKRFDHRLISQSLLALYKELIN